jgi:hypothetical protein
MADFTVGGKQFKTKHMDLFVQAKVVKRFGRLGFIMSFIQESLTKGEPLDKTIVTNIPAIMMAVGSLNDPDFEFIRDACLDAVQVQLNGSWGPLRSSSGALMWGDMSLMELCQVLGHVIRDIFFPFFREVAAISPADEATTA